MHFITLIPVGFLFYPYTLMLNCMLMESIEKMSIFYLLYLFYLEFIVQLNQAIVV